jgi:uncharacterized membrane protein
MKISESRWFTLLWINLLIISIICFLVGLCLQAKYCFVVGSILAILGALILSVSFCTLFMDYSINKNLHNCRTRLICSVLVNICFSLPILFILNFRKCEPFLVISTALATMLSIIILLLEMKCNKLKIEHGDDVSLLKATNCFLVFLFTTFKYLINLLCCKENLFIDYYFILPLLAARGFYEILDMKSKGLLHTQKDKA